MIVELTVEPPSMWPFKSNQIEHRQCYPIDATFIIIPWSTISIGNHQMKNVDPVIIDNEGEKSGIKVEEK
ncbi:hypothetical protein BLOT_015176 [Blomia tropicalis]|nr:hypothetical protein BLOT_015176 [Blomia tropicalis]